MSMSCDLRGLHAEKAVRQYTDLHEGTPPQNVVCGSYNVPMGGLTWLGNITDIQYDKRVRENGRLHSPPYHHPFAPFAQPALYKDSTGSLFVRGHFYYTTERGIEDWKRKTAKNIAIHPKRLVVLGKLEWIRYNDGYRNVDLRFADPGQPEVAHDELGKLHILGGRKPNYLRENPMRHRRSRHHSRRARHNPSHTAKSASGMSGAEATQVVVSAGIASLAAVATMKGLAAVSLLNDKPALRALADVAAGAGVGLGLLALGAPSALGGGVMIGGMAKGISSGVDLVRGAMAARSQASQASGSQPPASGSQPPAPSAALPGGTWRGMHVGARGFAAA